MVNRIPHAPALTAWPQVAVDRVATAVAVVVATAAVTVVVVVVAATAVVVATAAVAADDRSVADQSR